MNRLPITVLLLSILALSCSIGSIVVTPAATASTRDSENSQILPPAISEPSQGSSALPEATLPTEGLIGGTATATEATRAELPLALSLSRVLTHTEQELIDYYTSLAQGRSFFLPGEGWQEVLVELAATSDDWTNLPQCAHEPQLVVMDTGGFQRDAGKLYVVDFTELQKLLPPGASQRLWAKTAIPTNQEPARISVSICGEAVEWDASEAIQYDFASRYEHPQLPMVPGEVIVELEGSARLIFDFSRIAYIQYEDPFGPDVGQILVPTRVENIGGDDLAMGYTFDWSEYITLSGFASNGFLVSTFDHPDAEFPRIPPGESRAGDVLFGEISPRYYPSVDPESLRVHWAWLRVEIHGQDPPGPYQMILNVP